MLLRQERNHENTNIAFDIRKRVYNAREHKTDVTLSERMFAFRQLWSHRKYIHTVLEIRETITTKRNVQVTHSVRDVQINQMRIYTVFNVLNINYNTFNK